MLWFWSQFCECDLGYKFWFWKEELLGQNSGKNGILILCLGCKPFGHNVMIERKIIWIYHLNYYLLWRFVFFMFMHHIAFPSHCIMFLCWRLALLYWKRLTAFDLKKFCIWFTVLIFRQLPSWSISKYLVLSLYYIYYFLHCERELICFEYLLSSLPTVPA
jgi:hypothetical protein